MTSACRILRATPKEIVYAPESFRAIDARLLSDCFANNQNQYAVFRPINPDRGDLNALKQQIPAGSYFTQLGYVAERSQIRHLPQQDPSSPIVHLAGLPSLEHLQNVARTTVREDFIVPWQAYLGEKISTMILDDLMSHLDPERAVMVTHENLTIGLVVLFASQDCLGVALEQVGWIWVAQSVAPSVRAATRMRMAEWLWTREVERYQAGIHLYHERSQKFFERLGFRVTCAHILKKSA